MKFPIRSILVVSVVFILPLASNAVVRNSSECGFITERLAAGNATQTITGIKPSIQIWQGILLFLGFGTLAGLMATGFNLVRKNVFNDKDNIDTDFNAGGKVSVGLTATTIVSQWTWAATLLQSSTVASKYGISGPFWYASGATIQILLFSMISVQLKIRAPGAKTFLQVIRARFGKRTHLTFCVFALMTNVIVTAMLMLGGAAVLTNLVEGLSVEYATCMVAAVIGTYTSIGGLGATFYVSYTNTAMIFIIMITFIMKVYNEPNVQTNILGSVEKMYNYLRCSIGPSGNQDNSYLTLVSNPGLMFGIINIVGNFGTVFVDQSYWQSSVAAKPKQGVWGFLSGGLVWFAVPFSFATTMGLSYIALSTEQGKPLLSPTEVDAGLVPPVVAQRLMGQTGEMLVVIMILMAIVSTGSAEVIAVTSILVYDIYQLYLKPYRLVIDTNSCILCGRGRGRMANPRDKCVCESMTFCADCNADDEARRDWKRAIKPDYKCRAHGAYRTYNDYLGRLKNWCLLWAVISILPLTLVLNMLQVSLGWVYLFMGIMIGSAVVPISLCMFWGRLTGHGMMAGAIGGMVTGIVSWLVVASTYPGGLSQETFFTNTGNEISMLVGNVTAIGTGAILTIIVTFVTNRHYDSSNTTEIWENTRDIDNPLSPWTEMYARELNITGAHQLDNRPSLEEVTTTFRAARIIANVGAVVLTFVLVVLWPACMISAGVLDLEQFRHWVNSSQAWTIIGAVFIIAFPVVSEAIEIRKILSDKSSISPSDLRKPLSRGTKTPTDRTKSKTPTSRVQLSGGGSTPQPKTEDAGETSANTKVEVLQSVSPKEVNGRNSTDSGDDPRQPIFP